jgi:phosphatidylinositol phospholipase C gamma-1
LKRCLYVCLLERIEDGVIRWARILFYSRRNGEVQHCRIKSKQENGQAKYYLVEQVTFDSLFNLVNYYQSKPLRTPQFEIILTEPIPQVCLYSCIKNFVVVNVERMEILSSIIWHHYHHYFHYCKHHHYRSYSLSSSSSLSIIFIII